MATSNDTGAAGAGGKFRKKPFRKAATPYDRPPTALRGTSNPNGGSSNNNSSLFTKLVVDPASKLISYGAQRFFSSVFRKRLTNSPHPPEVPDDLGGGLDGAVPNNQYGAQSPGGVEGSRPVNSSSSNGNVISDLEQLLKQKTFTSSEINHLTELLQSRVAEESSLGEKTEKPTSNFERRQPLTSSPLEENIDERSTSHKVMSTPMVNSRVFVDDISSPAELAKAYMGSRPSKVSPSMLETRSQVGREETNSPRNVPFVLTQTTMRTPVRPDNGFIAPRSRGRSAIYSMARTQYSRFNPLANQKGSGLTSNGYGGPSMSTPQYLLEHNEKSDSKSMALKRRSSVFDDDLGSVSPIRRIRQKQNLLTHRTHVTPHGSGPISNLVETNNKGKKAVGENENPSTSYSHVPSKSSEVAAKILQHLETLTPTKEKASESKRDKSSPFKLTQSMLRGQALRSTEEVDHSKLLIDGQDKHKLENRSITSLPEKQEKLKENAYKESIIHSDKKSSSVEPLTASVMENGVAQPSQKKRSFRMSALEDSFEQDDDVQCNGFSEGRGPIEEKKLPPAEEPKPVETKIQPETTSPSGLILSKTSESVSVVVPALEKESAAFKSVPAFDKPKETNNPPIPTSFSSKSVETNSPFPSEATIKKPESKPENSSSLVNAVSSATNDTKAKIPESDVGGSLNPLKAGDTIEKSQTAPSFALNGFKPPQESSTAPSVNDANKKSTSNSIPFTFGPTSTGTSNNPFELIRIRTNPLESNTSPSVSDAPVFKFGPPLVSSAAPVSTNAVVSTDLKTTTQKDLNSIVVSVPSFGGSPFGLKFSADNFNENNLQGSLSGVGTSASSASLPAFSTTTSLFSTTTTNSQLFTPSQNFGFSSSSSSSDTSSVVPTNVPDSNVPKFGMNPPVTSSSPAIFSFGSNSSCSSSVTAVTNSSSGATTTTTTTTTTSPIFSFGANTSTSFSSGSSSVFNIGANSSSSAPTSNVFGSTWGNTKPSTFDFSPPAIATATAAAAALFTSPSPSTGFAFGTSPNPVFSIPSQPMFGNSTLNFAASNEMNNDDNSMAEDHPVQQQQQASSNTPPMFGQPAITPTPPGGFAFGSQANPFQFSGQQINNQVAPQNPSPFQASGSLEFNGGGSSFSLGTGGGDKSGRRVIKVNRNKNRKK